MTSFPLAPFLTSLAADGIRVTLQDYGRIHAALTPEQTWTLPRLRTVLIALLAKNPDQRAIIGRRFDRWLQADPDLGQANEPIDIQDALARLERMVQAEPDPAPIIQAPQPIANQRAGSRL